MEKKLLTIFTILSVFFQNINSQSVIVYGNESSWANQQLIFYNIPERISNTPDTLLCYKTEIKDIHSLHYSRSMIVPADFGLYKGPVFIQIDTTFCVNCNVDNSGNFYFRMNLKETSEVFVDLGTIKGSVFLEPGKEYHIKLPVKQDVAEKDKFNPFYKPREVYLQVVNSQPSDLNQIIPKFDDDYNNFINNYSIDFFYQGKKSGVDSIISIIDSKHPDSGNNFFKSYKKYRFAYLRHISYDREPIRAIKKYFANCPFEMNNPAYLSLLNSLSKNYLYDFSKLPQCKELTKNIETAESLSTIKYTISKSEINLNDTLAEYLILKSLYSGYYKNEFSLKTTVANLEMLQKQSKIKFIKNSARVIKSKITKLHEGFEAPDFSARNFIGDTVNLKSFGGKFLFLNFFNSQSYSCIQDLPVLDNIFKKHGSLIEIVTVSFDDDFDKVLQSIRDQGYKWTVVSAIDKKKLISDYRIASFPTYYLIDPEGNMSLSPAPSPREDFEARFFAIWKNRERQILRNDYKK